VIDTHELGRRAGAMLSRELTVAAPADFGTEVIGAPEGSELQISLRLEAVIEGVLVTGDVIAQIEGECSRCLAPLSFEMDVNFQELFEHPDDDNKNEDALLIEDDLLDLEPVVRDAVVLALPLAPLCSEDCLGLCTECGFELNNDPEHHHEIVDARWQSLQGLFEGDDSKEG
jgi:uncharacterized protein